MTTTLVIVSDLHINSTAGLCTPVVNRESGTYHAHRPQRELWESWLDFCKRAEAALGKKIAIVNGDLGELDTKRRTYELITPNKAEVMAVLPEVIEPLIKIVTVCTSSAEHPPILTRVPGSRKLLHMT